MGRAKRRGRVKRGGACLELRVVRACVPACVRAYRASMRAQRTSKASSILYTSPLKLSHASTSHSPYPSLSPRLLHLSTSLRNCLCFSPFRMCLCSLFLVFFY